MEAFKEDGDEVIGVVVFPRQGVGRLEAVLMPRVAAEMIFVFEDDSLLGVGEKELEKVGDESPDLERLFVHLIVLFLLRRLRFPFALERQLSED